MCKRDELDVVAVCRQGEETTPKAARARDKFFLLFGPAGGSHNISIQHANAKIFRNCTKLSWKYFQLDLNKFLKFNPIQAAIFDTGNICQLNFVQFLY